MVKYFWNEDVLPKEYSGFKIKDLSVKFLHKDNEYVEEGTDIITVYHFHACLGEKQFTITAPISGFLTVGEAYSWKNIHNNYGMHLYSIKTFDEVASIFDGISYDIYTDSFTHNKGIRWTYLPESNTSHPFYSINLSFSFEYDNGCPYLLIREANRPKQNDKLSLLFEDGSVLSFVVTDKVMKEDSHFKELVRYIICFELTESDLDKLMLSSVVSYRYESKGVKPRDYKISFYHNQELAQIVLKKYAAKFSEAIKELGHEWGKEPSEGTISQDEPCFVYLMVDTANGYHKIGISNHPEYREGTLQSEKPTIELLCAKQFPSRTIAKAIESALHKTYEGKHLRGEWFQLDAKDIIDLMATLK